MSNISNMRSVGKRTRLLGGRDTLALFMGLTNATRGTRVCFQCRQNSTGLCQLSHGVYSSNSNQKHREMLRLMEGATRQTIGSTLHLQLPPPSRAASMSRKTTLLPSHAQLSSRASLHLPTNTTMDFIQLSRLCRTSIP
jgi:hypothetical protein